MKKKPYKLIIHYSVDNMGDEAAYPFFFEDELCAEIHQGLMEEGWGEHCTGSLTIAGDGPMKSKDVKTRKAYIAELKSDLKEMGEFNSDERNRVIGNAIERLEAS